MGSAETKEGLKDLAASGGRWTATSAIASFVIQLSQFAILGRLMGPADFGLMAMMMVVIGLLALVADLGTTNFIVQTPSLTASQFGGTIAACVLASLAVTGSLVLLSATIAAYYRTPVLSELIPVTGIVLITTAAGQPFSAVLQRNMRFREMALAEIISGVAGTICAVAMASAGRGVWSLIAGQLASSSTKTLFSWFLSRRFLRPIWSIRVSEMTTAFRFGSFQVAERLFGYLALNVDKIIVGRILGEVSLGIYSVSYQIITKVVYIVNPVFTRVALPLFSRIQTDDARLIRGYLQTLRTIVLISFPVYLVLIISSGSVVRVLLGPTWASAVPIVSLLGGLGFVFTLSNPVGSLVIAKGRPDMSMLFTFIAVIVYGVSIYLGSFYGMQGVAIGYLLGAWLIMFPTEFWLRWKLVRMQPAEYLKAVGRISIAAALCLVVGRVIVTLTERISEVGGLDIIWGVLMVLIFLLLIWKFEKELLAETYKILLHK